MVPVVGVDHAPTTVFATEAYLLSPTPVSGSIPIPPPTHMSSAIHSPLSPSLPDVIQSDQNFSDSGSGFFANSPNTLITGGSFMRTSFATHGRNLASTYSSQGRWNEAEQLKVQVMRKKLLGAEQHPDTLISMGNLASVSLTSINV